MASESSIKHVRLESKRLSQQLQRVEYEILDIINKVIFHKS